MGVGVYVTSQKSFFLKMEGVSGFQTPSDVVYNYACHKKFWQKRRNYIKQPQVKK